MQFANGLGLYLGPVLLRLSYEELFFNELLIGTFFKLTFICLILLRVLFYPFNILSAFVDVISHDDKPQRELKSEFPKKIFLIVHIYYILHFIHFTHNIINLQRVILFMMKRKKMNNVDNDGVD